MDDGRRKIRDVELEWSLLEEVACLNDDPDGWIDVSLFCFCFFFTMNAFRWKRVY